MWCTPQTWYKWCIPCISPFNCSRTHFWEIQFLSLTLKTPSISPSLPPTILPEPKYSQNARAYTVQVGVSLAFMPKWKRSWAWSIYYQPCFWKLWHVVEHSSCKVHGRCLSPDAMRPWWADLGNGRPVLSGETMPLSQCGANQVRPPYDDWSHCTHIHSPVLPKVQIDP